MPEPGPFEYILKYLFEVGPGSLSAGNLVPLSWQEIKAWIDLIKPDLDIFEIELIRKLSVWYVQQYHESKNVNCPSPWQKQETAIDEIEECERFKSILGLFT